MFRPAIAFALVVASSASAETLIYNVKGIQVGADAKIQHFDRLLIDNDGKVLRTLNGLDDVRLKADQRIDGKGRTLLPGLIDAHGHVMGLGMAAIQLDLVGTGSIAELQQRLRTYAAAHPNDAWLLGRGWNQELWSEKRFPTAGDLDAAVADRPAMLERVDGHAVVLNSAGLKAARITAATKDPIGGKVERDARGNPTGLLVDNAVELVAKVAPEASASQRDQALMKTQEACSRSGSPRSATWAPALRIGVLSGAREISAACNSAS